MTRSKNYLLPLLSMLLLLSNVGRASDIILARRSSGFTENKGQFRDQFGNPNPDVLCMADFGGINMQLRRDGFSYEV